MEKINACPVCSNREFEPYLTTRDYFYSMESFNIAKCKACGFLFTNPRPDEKDAARYYHSDAYISHSNADRGMVNRVYQLVRRHALKKKTRLVKKFAREGRALDIGCGTGHFLNELSRNGFEVFGIEPGESARKFAKEEFKLNVEKDLSALDKTHAPFTAITMWHVLEHVYQLNDYLIKIRNHLAKDGIFIVAVPNPECYDALHYKEYWAAFDLPRHLYHFTRDTMINLMTIHQFELVEILPMKFDSFYVSLLSEKYKSGKNNYPGAFFKGLQSNLSTFRNRHNYSSIIYVLKPKIS